MVEPVETPRRDFAPTDFDKLNHRLPVVETRIRTVIRTPVVEPVETAT